MKSLKKIDVIYLLLLFLPFLDLATGLSNRMFDVSMSVGMIFKGTVLSLGIAYVLLRSVSKYRKVTLIFFALCLLYILGYFVFKLDLIDGMYFITEVSYIVKLMYFPLITFILLNIFDDCRFEKSKLDKIFVINLLCYICLIAIPTVFGINFNSYSNSLYTGSVGWFFSANEISTILLLMFPFMYKYLKSKKWLVILIFSIALYTLSLIGTKVTLFGIIIISFLLLLCAFFYNKKENYKEYFLPLFMFLVVVIVMSGNYAAMNLKSALSDAEIIEIDNISENLDKNESLQNSRVIAFIKKYGEALLSHRNTYALNTWVIYKDNYRIDYLVFGMGFSNTSRIDDYFVEKLIEIDFLDIFFHLGIGALLIWLFPFIYALRIIIKKRKYNIEIFFFGMVILMTVGISSLAGHVYMAPAVSIYISLYFCYLFNACGEFEKRKLKKDKIAILGMHLGYGGVENVIANTASMLSEKYEVEIVSLYKNKESLPFKIDNKVKITYLFKTISNRREFLDALRQVNLFGVIKEGLKSAYILWHKEILMKKYIVHSNASLIISTRIEYSKILNEFGRDDAIKIHQEHTYSVSDKYIRNLNKLININFIMPVSKTLYDQYRKKIEIPLKFIPLALSHFPNSKDLSLLNTKHLISVGRLEPVKGYKDLIEVMEKLVKRDDDIYLNVFGDGSELNMLNDLIEEKHLQNKVKLWGYKNQDFIKKFIKESSLYVMTSLEESFGLVLIEAMSYGVPCIAFSTAKGAKSIIDKSNGFMIEDRDKEKMSEAILEYFALDDTRRKELGKNARKKSANYKFVNIKKMWLKFVKDILN